MRYDDDPLTLDIAFHDQGGRMVHTTTRTVRDTDGNRAEDVLRYLADWTASGHTTARVVVL